MRALRSPSLPIAMLLRKWRDSNPQGLYSPPRFKLGPSSSQAHFLTVVGGGTYPGSPGHRISGASFMN